MEFIYYHFDAQCVKQKDFFNSRIYRTTLGVCAAVLSHACLWLVINYLQEIEVHEHVCAVN